VEAQAAQAAFKSRGGEVVDEWPPHRFPALVVDGLLGIGLDRAVEGDFAAIIRDINAQSCPVLAIDIPSGIDSETGTVRGVAVRAAVTLTFIARKLGLCTGEGLEHAGRVELDTLGIGEVDFREARGSLLTPEGVCDWLGPRARNSHKGNFGSVGIIGGNRGMVGAALLAARAALMTGAGKVYVGLARQRRADRGHGAARAHAAAHGRCPGGRRARGRPRAGRSPSATSVSMFERSVLPCHHRLEQAARARRRRAQRDRLQRGARRGRGPRPHGAHDPHAPPLRSGTPPRDRDRRRAAQPPGCRARHRAQARHPRGAEGRRKRLRAARRALVRERDGKRGPCEWRHRRCASPA
jgi:hypothetical protein